MTVVADGANRQQQLLLVRSRFGPLTLPVLESLLHYALPRQGFGRFGADLFEARGGGLAHRARIRLLKPRVNAAMTEQMRARIWAAHKFCLEHRV